MSRTASDKYEFAPIEGSTKGSYCALDIYKPGSFFGQDGSHAVFVGGCGVGKAKTLDEAKARLLEEAKRYCQRRIDDAKVIAAHYERELAKLEAQGLLNTERRER